MDPFSKVESAKWKAMANYYFLLFFDLTYIYRHKVKGLKWKVFQKIFFV